MVGQGDRFAALPTQNRRNPRRRQRSRLRRKDDRCADWKGTVDNQTKIKRSVAFSLGHAEQGDGESMGWKWLEEVH
jgi:predicted pyridoxine 5'-phosphate oxidase superfamily flavin-nucleotide-binding protein